MDWKGDMDEQSEWVVEIDRGGMVCELLERPSRVCRSEVDRRR